MKKFINSLLAFLCVATVMPTNIFAEGETSSDGLTITNSTFAKDYDKMYNGDANSGYVENSYLGASQFFTLFGDKVLNGVTLDGNVAANDFSSKNDIGTTQMTVTDESGKKRELVDIHYFGESISFVQASIFKALTNEVVFGSNMATVDTSQKVNVGGKVTLLDSSNAFEEAQKNSYLDINTVLNNDAAKSVALANYVNQFKADYEDENNNGEEVYASDQNVDLEFPNNKGEYVIDITKVEDKSKNIFVHLPASALCTDGTKNMFIKGFTTDSESKEIIPHIFFVVDTNGYSDEKPIITNINLKLLNTDGTEVDTPYNQGDSTDVSLKNNNPLFWTFVDEKSSTAYAGTLEIAGGQWIGLTLVPNGKIDLASGNSYGNLIAKQVVAEGTAKRWNWSGYTDPTIPVKKSVRVVKYDKESGGKISDVSDMTFALNNDELNSSNDFTQEELEPGNYEISEKEAPTDYTLDKTPLNFSLSDKNVFSSSDGEITIVYDDQTKYQKDGLFVDGDGNLVVVKVNSVKSVLLKIKKFDYDEVVSDGANVSEDLQLLNDPDMKKFDVDKNLVDNPDAMKFTVSINEGKVTKIADKENNWTVSVPINASIAVYEEIAPVGYYRTQRTGENTTGLPNGEVTNSEDKPKYGFSIQDGKVVNPELSKLDNIVQDSLGSEIIFNKHDKPVVSIPLDITKVDQENSKTKLSDAKFSVYRTISNTKKEQTQRADSKYYLSPGDYTIEETEAPAGYELTDRFGNSVSTAEETRFEFNVSDSGKITITNEDGNKKVLDTLTQDTSSKKLAIHFTKQDKKKNAKLIIEKFGLPEIRPTEATQKEIFSTTTFEADENSYGQSSNNNLLQVNLAEEITPTSTYGATDAESEIGVPLTGAEFTILQNDEVMKENVSENYSITLKYGYDYTIIETKAPDGYDISKEDYTFMLNNSGEVVNKETTSKNDSISDLVDGELTFKKYDNKTFIPTYLPHTGGKGIQAFIYVGASLITLAGAYWIARKKFEHAN